MRGVAWSAEAGDCAFFDIVRSLIFPVSFLPAPLIRLGAARQSTCTAGSPMLRIVPAFAGLSSCHWHDEFAFREPAAHPTRGEGRGALLRRHARSRVRPLISAFPCTWRLPLASGRVGALQHPESQAVDDVQYVVDLMVGP